MMKEIGDFMLIAIGQVLVGLGLIWLCTGVNPFKRHTYKCPIIITQKENHNEKHKAERSSSGTKQCQ